MNAEFSGPTKDKTVRVFGALISNYLASDQWTTLFNEIFDQDCYNGVSLSQQGNELIQRLLNVLTPSQKAQVAQMFLNLSNRNRWT
uniref:Exportin(tRNA) n=1 Tax=Acrobeloides nanus TaxID=290746 RepID=A0A914BUL8_9BILA